MSEATCWSCPWRDATSHCRRRAPGLGSVGQAIWPSVAFEDWCGEHPERREKLALDAITNTGVTEEAR